MNLNTQLHFHNLQKVKNLEIKYNFMHRQCWGDFPAAVQDKYNDFCISKGLEPKTPSIKCGYLNDWIVYGETVEKAINGCDAVINTLNVSRKSDNPWAPLAAPKDMISKSASNVLKAMEKVGIKRFVALSTIGAGRSWKTTPINLKFIVSFSNLKVAFQDHGKQEEILEKAYKNITDFYSKYVETYENTNA